MFMPRPIGFIIIQPATHYFSRGFQAFFPGQKVQELLPIAGIDIEETPGISQKDIAALMGISASTVNYHISKLVEMNAVRREKKGIGVRYYKTPISVEHMVAMTTVPVPMTAMDEQPEIGENIDCQGCGMMIEPNMKNCPFCDLPLEPEYPEDKEKREMLERLDKAYKEGKISKDMYLRNKEKFGS